MSARQPGAQSPRFHAVEYGSRHDLADSQPAISAFLGKGFFDAHEKNPDTTDSTPCFFCLLTAEGDVVSWIHAFADTLTIRGTPHPWIWTGGLQTVPQWRGKGLATRLQHAGTEYVLSRGIGRGSVFSTDTTLKIYGRLGYQQPGFVQRYLMLRSPWPVIRGHLTKHWAQTLVNALATPAWRLGNGALRAVNHLRSRHADFVEVDSADSVALRTVLERIGEKRELHFTQSIEKLSWKVSRSARTGGQTRLYLLQPRVGGPPIGYAVARLRLEQKPLAERYSNFRMLALMDYGLLLETEDVYSAMLSNLCELAVGYDAEVLEVISHAPEVRRLSWRFGLVPIGRGMSFSFLLPPVWDLHGVNINDLSTWGVTHYSGDGPGQ